MKEIAYFRVNLKQFPANLPVDPPRCGSALFIASRVGRGGGGGAVIEFHAPVYQFKQSPHVTYFKLLLKNASVSEIHESQFFTHHTLIFAPITCYA